MIECKGHSTVQDSSLLMEELEHCQIIFRTEAIEHFLSDIHVTSEDKVETIQGFILFQDHGKFSSTEFTKFLPT